MSDDLITIKQAAALLSCNPMTVRRRLKAGQLGPVMRDGPQFLRLSKASVLEYIKTHSGVKP